MNVQGNLNLHFGYDLTTGTPFLLDIEPVQRHDFPCGAESGLPRHGRRGDSNIGRSKQSLGHAIGDGRPQRAGLACGHSESHAACNRHRQYFLQRCSRRAELWGRGRATYGHAADLFHGEFPRERDRELALPPAGTGRTDGYEPAKSRPGPAKRPLRLHRLRRRDQRISPTHSRAR